MTKKIDFALVILAQGCNPNGDPLSGGYPRISFDGHGEMSDVCIKHKIRNRLHDMGEDILVLSSNGGLSIKEKIDNVPELRDMIRNKKSLPEDFLKIAHEKWFDVRAFGQVFAIPRLYGKNGMSIPTRGPVSLGIAKTLESVDISEIVMTKNINIETNLEDPYKKDSSTIGRKYIVNRGIYVSYGSIFPQLARKTGFNDEDAEKLKMAMSSLFENDASAARPSGSMGIRLYWWEHMNNNGMAASIVVFRSLNIEQTEEFPYFECKPESMKGIELSVLGDI